MNMNDYQSDAVSTAIYPEDMEVIYPAMLVGAEAGEMQNKVQKLIRKGHLPADDVAYAFEVLDDEVIDAIVDECGDVLWGIANLLMDLNVSMEYAARRNVEKLASRASRGVIEGDGDNR